jgi:hypothetical protein
MVTNTQQILRILNNSSLRLFEKLNLIDDMDAGQLTIRWRDESAGLTTPGATAPGVCLTGAIANLTCGSLVD